MQRIGHKSTILCGEKKSVKQTYDCEVNPVWDCSDATWVNGGGILVKINK